MLSLAQYSLPSDVCSLLITPTKGNEEQVKAKLQMQPAAGEDTQQPTRLQCGDDSSAVPGMDLQPKLQLQTLPDDQCSTFKATFDAFGRVMAWWCDTPTLTLCGQDGGGLIQSGELEFLLNAFGVVCVASLLLLPYIAARVPTLKLSISWRQIIMQHVS